MNQENSRGDMLRVVYYVCTSKKPHMIRDAGLIFGFNGEDAPEEVKCRGIVEAAFGAEAPFEVCLGRAVRVDSLHGMVDGW